MKVRPQQIYVATTKEGRYVLLIDGMRGAESYSSAAEAAKERERLLALYLPRDVARS
jgi:hypothetical protein